MWYFKLTLTSCLTWLLFISFCESTAKFTGLIPTCIPVNLPLCQKTTDLISLDTTRRSHLRKSKRRNEDRNNDIDNHYAIPWQYNFTAYPTFTDDKSFDEVILSLGALHPLISMSCSKFIKLFLCSVYSPVCTTHGIVPPCSELCERVKDDCKVIVATFEIEWPAMLDCNYFPSSFSKTQRKSLEGFENYQEKGDSSFVISRQSPIIWSEALLDEGRVCIPPSEDDVVLPALQNLSEGTNSPNTDIPFEVYPDFGVWCPPDMKAPPSQSGFNFMGLPNCTAPCPNMYLSKAELWAVRYLILVLAVICVVVVTFTLLTFAINTKRFSYPERPIIFYACSYLVVSVVYLVGFTLGELVACNKKIVDENNEIVQGFTVVEGSHHRLCSIMFLILYYFTVSGTIWWLILTFTWLLAAGFKWGSEAIEDYHLYYHGLAWGLPAFQTLIVFIFNKIEGDNIAGVCFVGLYDTNGLRYLLLLPMCIYLIIGIVVLFTGFFCLNRVRKSLQDDEENRKKLARFMIRIGVFSTLYILPQVVLILIYVVEDTSRTQWEASWYVQSCFENGVPCPALGHKVSQLGAGSVHPGVFMFCIKYIMFLIVALPPLFWVASKKTLNSWSRFFSRKRNTSRNFANTTTDLLLNDSNGPHARDLKAKLSEKADNSVPFFGKFGDTELHGSSASVAAEYASKREGIQRQWQDESDSESTDSETSISDSELSRIIEYEANKNRGVRVVGRQNMTSKILRPNRTRGRSNGTNRVSTNLSKNVPTTSKLHVDEFLKTKPPDLEQASCPADDGNSHPDELRTSKSFPSKVSPKTSSSPIKSCNEPLHLNDKSSSRIRNESSNAQEFQRVRNIPVKVDSMVVLEGQAAERALSI